MTEDAATQWSRPPPPVDGDTLLHVDFRCNLYQLRDFELSMQKCRAEIHFAFYWTDTRLIGWNLPLPSELWGPSLDFVNRVEVIEVLGDQFELLAETEGRLKRVLRYAGVVSNPAKYHSFPFDFDDVKLVFKTHGTWLSLDKSAYGALPVGESYRLRSIIDKDGSLRRSDQGTEFVCCLLSRDLGEYRRLGVSFQLSRNKNESGCTATNFTISVYVARKAGYYFYKVLLPLWLVVAITFMLFFFDAADISSRISHVMTAILSAFALQYVANEMLPKLEYLTVIDKVTMVSYVGIFASAACSCVTKSLIGKNNDTMWADTFDRVGALGTISVWVVCTTAVIVPNVIAQRRVIHRFWNGNQTYVHGLCKEDVQSNQSLLEQGALLDMGFVQSSGAQLGKPQSCICPAPPTQRPIY